MKSNRPTPISAPILDAAGVVHRPAGAGFRIVSLVPSITELLFDLGLGEAVVGRTAFCVHPRNRVKAVKSVGGTKKVNFSKLQRLSPTHVIVNVDETPRELAEDMARLGYEVVVTHPIDVRDNLGLYRLIGRLFARERQAEALCPAGPRSARRSGTLAVGRLRNPKLAGGVPRVDRTKRCGSGAAATGR
jgi:ABC-type Fe3+-hydroxamate transport system substrate-binding protein